MHETMRELFRTMEAAGRGSTVPAYERALRRYCEWLAANGLDPLKATLQDLEAFQRYLAGKYRRPDHKPLEVSTQVTWLCAIKRYYRHLYRRGAILADIARKLKLPKPPRRKSVAAEHLTQQEAIALVQTQAARVKKKKEGTEAWAVEFRNLAMLSLALATGRRCAAIRDLKVAHLDHERNEVRVEWEKGQPGRVLPVAGWALAVAKAYAERARPVLLALRRLPPGADPGWLFLGTRKERICYEYLTRLVKTLQKRAAEENPDLDELPAKRLSSHSLRVTFATMMFLNGCGIRIVNDLLLHKHIGTTAKYTPLDLQDLRRCMRTAHPRA